MFSSTVSIGDVTIASQLNNVRKDIVFCGKDLPTSGGSANAQTLTVDSQVAAYANGLSVQFVAGYTNTGAMTFNVNGIGAVSVYLDKVELPPGTIKAGWSYRLIYDGTWKIIGGNTSLGWTLISVLNWANSSSSKGTGVINGASAYKAYKIFAEIQNASGQTTNFNFICRVNGETGAIYNAGSDFWNVLGMATGEGIGCIEFTVQNRASSGDVFYVNAGQPWNSLSVPGLYTTEISDSSDVRVDLTGLTPSTYIEEFDFSPLQNNRTSPYAITGNVYVWGLL